MSDAQGYVLTAEDKAWVHRKALAVVTAQEMAIAKEQKSRAMDAAVIERVRLLTRVGSVRPGRVANEQDDYQ
jgi:hypothetical protein